MYTSFKLVPYYGFSPLKMSSNKHMIIPYMEFSGITKSRHFIKGGIHGDVSSDATLLKLKHQ